MTDWINTRLAVSYTDEDNNTATISPIDSFSPTFAMNSEPMHSIEQTHIGLIHSPTQITFQMQVRACGGIAAKLTALAMQSKSFDILVQEETGDEWAFSSLVLTDCYITSAVPTSATPTGTPTATFSGVSLGVTAKDKEQGEFTLPAGVA